MKWNLLRPRRASIQRRSAFRPVVERLETREVPTSLPAGFAEIPVASGLAAPSNMEFAPDGRLFVLEQAGNVKLVRNDGTTFQALHLTVDFNGERGLLGIAFDPNYATNHFVYLYYTNPNAGGTATGVHNQISRFTVDDTNPQSPIFGNETPILDLNDLSTAQNHNGGSIHFGLDGMLYAGVGENANPANSQTLSNLLGKFLRIDVDGYAGIRDDTMVGHIIPADNPFVNNGATGINQLVYALGLRNPYTFAVQPGTGTIYINDVGENTWEEIDLAFPGANYGWSNSEGFKQPTDPSTTIGVYTDPLLAYNHFGGAAGGGNAIVGGVFYNPADPSFPSQYVGKYFYEDLGFQWIRVFDPADPGSLANPDTSSGFATGDAGSTVAMLIDRTGNLYYLSAGEGAVKKIVYAKVWDGGGADNNWMTAANWVNDVAPQSGDNLYFPGGAARLTNANNFPSGTSFRSITFTGNGYGLIGNPITLTNGVNNISGTNQLSFFLTLGGAQAFTANTGSLLSVNSVITDSGFLLRLDTIGTGQVSMPVTLSGPGTLWKTGSGTVQFSGNNSAFTGNTTVSSGTVVVRDNNAFGTGTLTLQNATILAESADRTLANPVILSGTTSLGGTFNLTFTDQTTLTANRTLNVTNTTTFSGNIVQSGGSYKLSKTGAGALRLSGNNTFTGGLTIAAGSFLVGSNTAAGTGLLTLVTSTVQADGAARTLANAVSFGGTTTFGGTLDITFTGAGTLTGNRTFQVNNTGLTTFSGNIGQTSAFKLTKSGAGTLLLSGNNTYSGGFSLSAGTLAVGSNTAAGTGTLTFLGGTIRANGGARSLANPVILGNFTVDGSFNLTLSGAAQLTATRTLTLTNTGLTTISGVISQDAPGRALIKAGAGTLLLSGNNTYSGSTTVNAGLLRVNGSQPGSVVIVKTGGTLGGTGTVGAVQVQAGGALSPGGSPGILTAGNVNYLAGSSFTVELNGTTAGSGYDQVNATGTVNLGSSALNVTLGFTPAVGQAFTIINNDGTDAIIGTFSGLAEGATISLSGMLFQISYVGGTGNDVVLVRIS